MASFLDQASLIKTAAIEKVVAPIAVHLVHLVLLCERAEGLEGPEQFTQLEGEAQAVARATMNMAAVAYRWWTLHSILSLKVCTASLAYMYLKNKGQVVYNKYG